MKLNVIVKPKEAVLDPQGAAVRDAMRHLGMPEVRSVRIGKYMEIDLEGDDAGLEKRLHGLCRDLLSNPVIEEYELMKVPVSAKATARHAKNGEHRTDAKAKAKSKKLK
jgi:phosphoribosylformylglycinamidine synthase PurS subunit